LRWSSRRCLRFKIVRTWTVRLLILAYLIFSLALAGSARAGDLPSRADLVSYIARCARAHGVDPGFAVAVATIESRLQCGPLGRRGTYLGPMGIHKTFRARWNIDNPWVNVEVGVKALRGRDQVKVLRRYNASFSPAYLKAVRQVQRAYNGGQ
jgi:hypothetical protein